MEMGILRTILPSCHTVNSWVASSARATQPVSVLTGGAGSAGFGGSGAGSGVVCGAGGGVGIVRPGICGSGMPGRPGMVGDGCAEAAVGTAKAITTTPSPAAKRRLAVRPRANLLVDTMYNPNVGCRFMRSPKAQIQYLHVGTTPPNITNQVVVRVTEVTVWIQLTGPKVIWLTLIRCSVSPSRQQLLGAGTPFIRSVIQARAGGSPITAALRWSGEGVRTETTSVPARQ